MGLVSLTICIDAACTLTMFGRKKKRFWMKMEWPRWSKRKWLIVCANGNVPIVVSAFNFLHANLTKICLRIRPEFICPPPKCTCRHTGGPCCLKNIHVGTRGLPPQAAISARRGLVFDYGKGSFDTQQSKTLRLKESIQVLCICSNKYRAGIYM